MARYNDNAPIGHTCPIIDGVIGRMKSAKTAAEYILKYPEDYKDEGDNIVWELFSAIKEMEDIRSANSELRDWGNEQYNSVEELVKENEDLIRDKELLEYELLELRSQIQELEESSC